MARVYYLYMRCRFFGVARSRVSSINQVSVFGRKMNNSSDEDFYDAYEEYDDFSVATSNNNNSSNNNNNNNNNKSVKKKSGTDVSLMIDTHCKFFDG